MNDLQLLELRPELEQRTTAITLIVPGKPLSQNDAWKVITVPRKGGGAPHSSLGMTTEGRDYKGRVARLATLMRPEGWDRDNQYLVSCVYYFESMQPDVDGPGKLILDAMEDFELKIGKKERIAFTGLYKNDRQVWDFRQRREIDRNEQRAEITIQLLKPWKPQQRSLI